MATNRGRTLKTPDDVFEYFDVDLDDGNGKPLTLEEKNAQLSRRVYKGTGCGAWAEIREKQEARLRRAVWEGAYQNFGGDWMLTGMRETNGAKAWTMDVPKDVGEFFAIDWMPSDERIQFALNYLENEQLPKDTTFFVARCTILTPFRSRSVFDFVVGSIVEGVDQCAGPEYVRLPCKERDIREAIEQIEREVQDIWNETHGCEKCFGGVYAANDSDINPVDPDCESCGGDGISI